MFGDDAQGFDLLFRIHDLLRSSECNDGAIVRGMIEGRPRQNQAIDKRYCHARPDTSLKSPKHAASRRTVQIKFLPIPPIQCRNDEWLASHTKSDVSEKSSVQDLADRFPVVRSSVGNAVELTSPWRIHRLPVSGS